MGRVESYYDENAQKEWDRLDRYQMEFATTMEAFHEYLPLPPAAILDLGGGPGRYSISLALRGYVVTLADISSKELEFAQMKAQELGAEIAGYRKVSGTDLSDFADQSFDAVLLMGPLYHLIRETERQQIVLEAYRMLNAGGVVLAAFITRNALIRDVAKHRPELILSRGERWERTLATGILDDDGEVPSFTEAHLVHPREVQPLMEQGGFDTLDLIASEGIVSHIDEAINALNGEAWAAWVQLNYRLSKDPSVHGTADHLLYVGRRHDRSEILRMADLR